MKTYTLTDKDIERLLKSFKNGSDSYWYESRVDEWLGTLPTPGLLTEIVNDSKYKPIEEHPEKLEINTYWSNGGYVSYLREGLPYDHEENLYNWFIRNYPDLNPSFYNIKIPQKS